MAKRFVTNEEIKPAPYNPRNLFEPGDADWISLEQSIKDHGIANPIIWNQATGHVIGGHQRWTVAKHLGWKRYKVGSEVVIINEPDLTKEKQLNVRLNKIGQREEIWNEERLGHLLAELVPNGADSNLLTGFTPTEMAAVFAGMQTDPPGDGDGPVRSRSGEPSAADTRYVQLYYNGEEFKEMIAGLKLLKVAWDLETPAEVCLQAIKEAAEREGSKIDNVARA